MVWNTKATSRTSVPKKHGATFQPLALPTKCLKKMGIKFFFVVCEFVANVRHVFIEIPIS